MYSLSKILLFLSVEYIVVDKLLALVAMTICDGSSQSKLCEYVSFIGSLKKILVTLAFI
ncbi:MAG: hypothetical protein QXP36_03035 [Conexivisphaerales archaeon]